MNSEANEETFKLSVVIPCFNEEGTLEACARRVLGIADESLSLEIIIVDDCSCDASFSTARRLEKEHLEVIALAHEVNMGKGASLRTGFKMVSGDFVAVQDADLEYDPMDLKRLLSPLRNDEADVVIGSRFLSSGAHRVLYFWHYVGNRILTLLSNMFTDLNLSDVESCYKVFKREVIEQVKIKENRFGFEPEIVAKIAHMRLRIFEMGISYYGRTYEEGKKIGLKDGFRALYCISRYSAHKAPLPIQFLLYILIAGFSAIVNSLSFSVMTWVGSDSMFSASIAFLIAAVVNYVLCITILFRHRARWSSLGELVIYFAVAGLLGVSDVPITRFIFALGVSPGISKISATSTNLFLNFLGIRFLVFPESPSGTWRPQLPQ